MTQVEFALIVEQICRSRRSYTFGNTLAEVVLYLAGYAHGARVEYLPAHTVFTPFLDWVGIDLGDGTDPWLSLLARYPNEQAAIDDLPRLYSAFSRSLSSAGSPETSAHSVEPSSDNPVE